MNLLIRQIRMVVLLVVNSFFFFAGSLDRFFSSFLNSAECWRERFFRVWHNHNSGYFGNSWWSNNVTSSFQFGVIFANLSILPSIASNFQFWSSANHDMSLSIALPVAVFQGYIPCKKGLPKISLTNRKMIILKKYPLYLSHLTRNDEPE